MAYDPGQDPAYRAINGELASKDQLELLETLATQVLAEVPAIYDMQHDFLTETGSCVTFNARVYEGRPNEGSVPSVVISSPKSEDVLLEVSFGFENEKLHERYDSEDSYGEITGVIQDLLIHCDDLPPDAAAILRHLREVVFCKANGENPDYVEILPTDDPTQDFRFVGDVIRSIVASSTNHALRRKEWDTELNEYEIISASSNEFVGELNFDPTKLPFPAIMIQYNDLTNLITYTYSRLFDGEVMLDTVQESSSHEEALAMGDELEAEIYKFIDGLGGTQTGKVAVDLLTDKIYEASSVSVD